MQRTPNQQDQVTVYAVLPARQADIYNVDNYDAKRVESVALLFQGVAAQINASNERLKVVQQRDDIANLLMEYDYTLRGNSDGLMVVEMTVPQFELQKMKTNAIFTDAPGITSSQNITQMWTLSNIQPGQISNVSQAANFKPASIKTSAKNIEVWERVSSDPVNQFSDKVNLNATQQKMYGAQLQFVTMTNELENLLSLKSVWLKKDFGIYPVVPKGIVAMLAAVTAAKKSGAAALAGDASSLVTNAANPNDKLLTELKRLATDGIGRHKDSNKTSGNLFYKDVANAKSLEDIITSIKKMPKYEEYIKAEQKRTAKPF